MKRVVIESPYAGKPPAWMKLWIFWFLYKLVELILRRRNIRYLRAAMHDCLLRGEAPFASHALYTQPGVLRDWIKDERTKGIQAGFIWGSAASRTAVYIDLGITPGMEWGLKAARVAGRTIEYRSLASPLVARARILALSQDEAVREAARVPYLPELSDPPHKVSP